MTFPPGFVMRLVVSGTGGVRRIDSLMTALRYLRVCMPGLLISSSVVKEERISVTRVWSLEGFVRRW
jgi:hypothetical protein